MSTSRPRCKLLHHGVAANSSPKVVTCITRPSCRRPYRSDDEIDDHKHDKTDLVYASHLMLNVASPRDIPIKNTSNSGEVNDGSGDNANIERIWKVENTLRTSTSLNEAETATAAANVSTRTAKRVITCVVQLKRYNQIGTLIYPNAAKTVNEDDVILVCGFSDGTLTSWIRQRQDWKEHILLASAADRIDPTSLSLFSVEEAAAAATKGRSITDVDGFFCDENENDHDNKHVRRLNVSVCACSSGGAHYFRFSLTLDNDSGNFRDKEDKIWNEEPKHYSKHATIKATKRLIRTPSNAVKFNTIVSKGNVDLCEDYNDNGGNSFGFFLVGTAAPRHNKIHVLVVHPDYAKINTIQTAPIYSGSLAGHEDWITCFDWTTNISITQINIDSDRGCDNTPITECCYLASGSQDHKIRLWKWVTTSTKITARTAPEPAEKDVDDFSNAFISENSDADIDDEDEEEEVIEGEARLEITQPSYNGNNHQLITSVYLEALLIGHEEMVTSVAWHPNPKMLYGQDLILVSSSMDRSIFLWSSSDCNNVSNNSDGAWLPIARVGSPSGILGGPVGASLLGYLSIQVEPEYGRWIMGHAYGGALHFFSCEQDIEDGNCNNIRQNVLTVEERSALVEWRAQPCITGHFDEVTDLCWEALGGKYLISVSNDATCRLWAPMNTLDVWIEISRPQVHGYSLSAVTSLSTIDHKHHLVTGADEKELRVFDGTNSFLRMLYLISRQGRTEDDTANDDISRVDRAYMPSLGLSNKDTAADGADEDTLGASVSSTLLPLERDLGSISLWPETRKLYGHNSEIARLASTLSARTCISTVFSTPYIDQVLIASSTKARDVNTANIRIWDVDMNKCLQILQGGHRSTVTALSFSPDGTYLASSGKDRRLCIWKRYAREDSSGQNDLFFLASDVKSSHKRIVWSVHFCPYEPTVLASGSRDGTIKLWRIVGGDDGTTSVSEYSKFIPVLDGRVNRTSNDKAEAVTSLAFSPIKSFNTNRGILAIGLENGFLQLWYVPVFTRSDECKIEPPSLAMAFDVHICHIGAVRKLAWRPTVDSNIGPSVLASCSSDNGCRIFSVWL